MSFKNILLISCVAIFAIGCSTTPEPMASAEQSKLSGQKGFSLSLPNENEWSVVNDSPHKIVMTKPGQSMNDRYMIQALVVKLPKFNSDKDFMNFIANKMKKSQKQSGAKVTKKHMQFVEGQDAKCVQYNSKEQHSNKITMLEVVSFTCRHPDRENAGVYLAYSKKYSKGNDDKNFNENAAGVFSYMALAEF